MVAVTMALEPLELEVVNCVDDAQKASFVRVALKYTRYYVLKI